MTGTRASGISVLAVIVSLVALQAAAEESRFSARIGPLQMFGSTAYDLYASDGEKGVLSKLVFPLDGLAASFDGSYSTLNNGREEWIVRLRGGYRLTLPENLMEDYDWEDPLVSPPIAYRYTESEVQAQELSAAVTVQRRLTGLRVSGLYLSAGYRFQLATQIAKGYIGWWYDVLNEADDTYTLVEVSNPADALEYRLYLHSVTIGLSGRMQILEKLSLNLSAGYMPTYAYDYDDHLLRNKLSTAYGLGHGLYADLELIWKPFRRAGRSTPYLAASADVMSFRVSTTQTQRWYGDDPNTPGDETGRVNTGIGHDMKGTQYCLGILAGLEFD